MCNCFLRLDRVPERNYWVIDTSIFKTLVTYVAKFPSPKFVLGDWLLANLITNVTGLFIEISVFGDHF